MDPSNKKVRKAIRATSVIVRGRPAREGDKTRAGVPVAFPSPTPAPPDPQNPASSSRPLGQQPPSKAHQARPPSELARGGMGEAISYLAHLVSHLRRERERRGMSLTDLSAGSGLDRGMLCKLENGRIANPTFFTLWRYSMALDPRPSLVLLDACRSAAGTNPERAVPQGVTEILEGDDRDSAWHQPAGSTVHPDRQHDWNAVMSRYSSQ